ncbi:hypothetical protein GV64_00485 [Endozoicomonas elysicola]|uniref:Uncharacterized protein n=1 Tax=Endozoicomonas elysicola TaxID=305900 RepID=A0A081K5I6_9GAMM|nr:hypothetical protein GV64_00485 [Endozoicomonas elysicola]
MEQYQQPHDDSFRRCEALAGIDQYSVQLKSKLKFHARLWDYGFLIQSLIPATQKLSLTSIESKDTQQFLSYVKAKTVESYPLVELPPIGVDLDDAVDRSFVTTQRHFSEAEVVYMYMQREISLVGREGTLANRIKCVFDEQAQHQFLDSLKQIRATLRERYLEFRGAACSEVT